MTKARMPLQEPRIDIHVKLTQGYTCDLVAAVHGEARETIERAHLHMARVWHVAGRHHWLAFSWSHALAQLCPNEM